MKICSAVLALSLVFSPAVARDAGWSTYANPRFGVIADYPPAFTVRDPPPANSDGQGFQTSRGEATFMIFGTYNVDGVSSEDLMRLYKSSGVVYSYARATERWFALSGTDHRRIAYLRCSLGPSDVVGCARLEYPANESRRWSPIVERVSRSLRIAPVHID